MIKTAAIPMDKEIQSFQFIFTGQQYMVMNFDQGIFEIIGRDWAEGHLPYIVVPQELDLQPANSIG